jgi:2,4-dienoyl-CoA reductase-like NADH-dependent reductase (Old Yellow Enzyme family)/thioredoxin reductase
MTDGEKTGQAALDSLWLPLRLGPVVARNRIMFSAHATWHEPDRYAGYLGARAKGGAGAIFTGAMCVHPSSHNQWINAWEPETAGFYRQWASAVHDHGGLLVAQLHHMGLQGMPAQTFAMMSTVMGPSGGTASPMWGHFGHEMTHADIAEMVEYFARSAEIARAGGLDGVEIHAAHGYLLFSFLSPLTNTRQDEYGGSVENRCRAVVDTIRAVRARVGDDFMVGLKYAFDENVGPLGITPDDAQQCLHYIASRAAIDYVSLSGSGYHSLEWLVPTAESEFSSHMAELGPRVRQAVPAVPVLATCGVRTIDQAAALVASGKVDMVGMVRPQIAEPDLVNKARRGALDDIRPCVGANQGCWRRMGRGGQVTCTVNPEAGREIEWKGVFDPTMVPGRVVVVGAGLKAAESAARRGHEVILVERDTEPGGQLRAADRLPGRDKWHRLINHMVRSIDKLGVDLRLGTEMTLELARELTGDVIVIATGSQYTTDGSSTFRPDRRTIPGLSTIAALDPETVITDPSLAGGRTLIVDDHGAHMAMGLAALLAQLGSHVDLVTVHPTVGHDTGLRGSVDLPTMYPRLVRAGVTCIEQATVERIDGDRVTLRHIYGAWERTVEGVDSLVFSQTRQSRSGLFTELQQAGLVVEVIGDAYAPRDVDEAIYEGALSARSVRVAQAVSS